MAAIHISSIPRERFEHLLTTNVFLEPVIGSEVEWFADAAQTTLGTVANGLLFDRWTYVLLGRGGTSVFHVLRIESGVSTRDEATVQLLRVMKSNTPPVRG